MDRYLLISKNSLKSLEELMDAAKFSFNDDEDAFVTDSQLGKLVEVIILLF